MPMPNAPRSTARLPASPATCRAKTASGASAISASNRAQGWGEYEYTYPRWVTKIDWNITDNHILELTGVQDNSKDRRQLLRV